MTTKKTDNVRVAYFEGLQDAINLCKARRFEFISTNDALFEKLVRIYDYLQIAYANSFNAEFTENHSLDDKGTFKFVSE